jgi:hypothetical protein
MSEGVTGSEGGGGRLIRVGVVILLSLIWGRLIFSGGDGRMCVYHNLVATIGDGDSNNAQQPSLTESADRLWLDTTAVNERSAMLTKSP